MRLTFFSPALSDDGSDTEDCIEVETDILPEAQQLLDASLNEIAYGNPPLELSTTQVALARGAGRSGRDSYIPGTVMERAYMRAKSTIAEKDMGDQTLDELASNDVVFTVDISRVPSTAPARTRPQRSIKKVDWSHLLSDGDNGSGEDMAKDEDFNWDI